MKNLIAATYAPMNRDYSLNLSLIGRYATFLKTNKVSGGFVNGSTGDFVSLSVTERKELIDAWAKNKPEDFKIINHVGHNNLREAKELAAHSADKVDAIAVLAPYYFRLNNLDKLIVYCREIAKCAPDLPFYYYHIPVLTGANFQMIDFIESAMGAIPNFAGIKYTQNNLVDYQKCKNYNTPAYNILFGVDEQLLASLPYGAEGWVGSTYNHLAPLYYEIISSFHDNDFKKATFLQEKAVYFVETLDKLAGFNGAGKSFMRLFGLDMGPCRFPHNTMSDQQLNVALHQLNQKDVLAHLSREFSRKHLEIIP